MVAPESINGSRNPWRDAENDGIDYIKAVVEDVSKKYRIDPTRIYLVGYSAGAIHSCRIGVPNSDFFTGIIAYAGASGQGVGSRKIPVALIHGTADRAVNFSSTERLAKILKDADWPVYFKPISGGGHGYNAKYDNFGEMWAGWPANSTVGASARVAYTRRPRHTDNARVNSRKPCARQTTPSNNSSRRPVSPSCRTWTTPHSLLPIRHENIETNSL